MEEGRGKVNVEQLHSLTSPISESPDAIVIKTEPAEHASWTPEADYGHSDEHACTHGFSRDECKMCTPREGCDSVCDEDPKQEGGHLGKGPIVMRGEDFWVEVDPAYHNDRDTKVNFLMNFEPGNGNEEMEIGDYSIAGELEAPLEESCDLESESKSVGMKICAELLAGNLGVTSDGQEQNEHELKGTLQVKTEPQNERGEMEVWGEPSEVFTERLEQSSGSVSTCCPATEGAVADSRVETDVPVTTISGDIIPGLSPSIPSVLSSALPSAPQYTTSKAGVAADTGVVTGVPVTNVSWTIISAAPSSVLSVLPSTCPSVLPVPENTRSRAGAAACKERVRGVPVTNVTWTIIPASTPGAPSVPFTVCSPISPQVLPPSKRKVKKIIICPYPRQTTPEGLNAPPGSSQPKAGGQNLPARQLGWGQAPVSTATTAATTAATTTATTTATATTTTTTTTMSITCQSQPLSMSCAVLPDGTRDSSSVVLIMPPKPTSAPAQAEEKIHVCGECHEKFIDDKQLTKHFLKIHGRSQIHRCPECHKMFSGIRRFKAHIAEQHKAKVSEMNLCPYCGKQIDRKCVFEQHIKAVHQGLKPFVCLVCGKRFGYKCTLDFHLARKHKGSKDAHCPEGRKKGASNSQLKIRTSDGDRGEGKFTCTECSKTFPLEQLLKKHVFDVHRAATKRKVESLKAYYRTCAKKSTQEKPSPADGKKVWKWFDKIDSFMGRTYEDDSETAGKVAWQYFERINSFVGRNDEDDSEAAGAVTWRHFERIDSFMGGNYEDDGEEAMPVKVWRHFERIDSFMGGNYEDDGEEAVPVKVWRHLDRLDSFLGQKFADHSEEQTTQLSGEDSALSAEDKEKPATQQGSQEGKSPASGSSDTSRTSHSTPAPEPPSKERKLGNQSAATSQQASMNQEAALCYVQQMQEAMGQNPEMHFALTLADRMQAIKSRRRCKMLQHKVDCLIQKAWLEETACDAPAEVVRKKKRLN